MTGFRRDQSGYWIEKDPSASLPYTLSWAEWLRGSDAYWSARRAYLIGDEVTPSAGALNGRRYRCTTAGITAATEPTWPSSGTVTDGTVVWTYIASQDTITGEPVWTVPDGLTLVSDSNTTHTATAVISGGSAGVTYTVACRITTVAGLVDERSFRIVCRDR